MNKFLLRHRRYVYLFFEEYVVGYRYILSQLFILKNHILNGCRFFPKEQCLLKQGSDVLFGSTLCWLGVWSSARLPYGYKIMHAVWKWLYSVVDVQFIIVVMVVTNADFTPQTVFFSLLPSETLILLHSNMLTPNTAFKSGSRTDLFIF